MSDGQKDIVEHARVSVERCCGSLAGELMCENFGCGTVSKLLTFIESLRSELETANKNYKGQLTIAANMGVVVIERGKRIDALESELDTAKRRIEDLEGAAKVLADEVRAWRAFDAQSDYRATTDGVRAHNLACASAQATNTNPSAKAMVHEQE